MHASNFQQMCLLLLVLMLHICITSADIIICNWCKFPVYAWSVIGPKQSDTITIKSLSDQTFPTSTEPSVNIKLQLDPALGKPGTGQLQFEYTVASRTFWDVSMIDGVIVIPPPNLPGNIFAGHNFTVTPRGNVEDKDGGSRCRQVNVPASMGFSQQPPNVYWQPNNDAAGMRDCPVKFGDFYIDLCGSLLRPFPMP